jgi:hypothetical protein
VDQITVTANAVVLKNLASLGLDHDRFHEVLSGELLSVAPTIFGLRDVLVEKRGRQVAVDTNRNLMVTRLLPRIVLRLHDVAIHTSSWIRLQVRQTLGVSERIGADARGRADCNGKHQRKDSAAASGRSSTARLRFRWIGSF